MSTDERRVEVHPGCEAVVDFDPALTFECIEECTWCCTHGVLLYEEDFFELAKHADLNKATTTFRGENFVTREQKDRDEHVNDEGQACFFLQDDGLCSLHLEHDWKPARCSVFPLQVTVENGDIHISIRETAHEHCEGLNVSERKVIDNLDAFLPKILWELDDPDSLKEF